MKRKVFQIFTALISAFFMVATPTFAGMSGAGLKPSGVVKKPGAALPHAGEMLDISGYSFDPGGDLVHKSRESEANTVTSAYVESGTLATRREFAAPIISGDVYGSGDHLRVTLPPVDQGKDQYFGIALPGGSLFLLSSLNTIGSMDSGTLPMWTGGDTALDFPLGGDSGAVLSPGEYVLYLLRVPAGVDPMAAQELWELGVSRFTMVADEPEDLFGWWVVKKETAGGAVLWGNVRIDPSNEEGRYYFNLGLDDGKEPYLVVEKDGDALSGEWFDGWDALLPGGDSGQCPWQGALSADGNTMQGPLGQGDETLTFFRAVAPDHETTGVWKRQADNAVMVAAYDRSRGFLMSLLDEGGNWYNEGRLKANVFSATEWFAGSFGWDSFEGLIFDGGKRMHLKITGDSPASGMLFDREENRAPRTGRWVIGDRKWDGNTRRGIAVVVEYDDNLYLHESWDALGDLSRGFRAVPENGGYADAKAGWAGRLSSDGNRITGEWVGYDGWYVSLDRTEKPGEDLLEGKWYSISLDLNHHDPVTGDIIRAYGTASVTRRGDLLELTDTYPDGRQYRLEAQWKGDHFEGEWWDTAEPDAKYPWNGEVQADGLYVHGSWDHGEWSFSAFPNVSSSEVSEDTDVVLIADPYSDKALVARNRDTETTLSVFQNQERITGIVFGLPAGEAEVLVDERMRPVAITGLGETATLVWAEDSGSVAVTIVNEKNGEEVSETLTVDLSDGALISALNELEGEETGDLEPLRSWIKENPGLVAAVAEGRDSGLWDGEDASREGKGRDKTSLRPFSRAMKVSGVVVSILGALKAVSAAGSGWFAATSFGVAAGGFASAALPVAVLAAGALFYVALIVNLLMLLNGDCCEHCSLLCFVACCPPKKGASTRRAGWGRQPLIP